MCRSCLCLVMGAATHLTVFLTYIIPRTAPVIRTMLLLWYLCVCTYAQYYQEGGGGVNIDPGIESAPLTIPCVTSCGTVEKISTQFL